MTIDRVTIELTGGPGGNGITTFYALDGVAAQPAVKALALSWRNLLPDDILLNVPNSGDKLNEETGELVGSWTGGSVGGGTGVDVGPWSAGVGCYISWRTAGFVHGRRVRGRTFIVPLGGNAFETTGLPKTTTVTALGIWATTLVEATPGNMVIWHRPTDGAGGSKHPITSLNVPTVGTSLRTRRT
jgi:hypothetical protein